MLTSNHVFLAMCIILLTGCDLPEPHSHVKSGLGLVPFSVPDLIDEINSVSDDIRFHRSLNLSADLRNPSPEKQGHDHVIVGATAMVLLCDTNGETCDEIFSPTAEFTDIPIKPHCGDRYDCMGDDTSFAQFLSDHYVDYSYSRGTASFIAPDIIITAQHNIKKEQEKLQRTYFLMNLGHGVDASWKKVTENGAEFLRVETKYILAIDQPLSSGTEGRDSNDWIALRVVPFQKNPNPEEPQVIPPHPHFCISTTAQRGAEILIPAHPRALPLKIANGLIVSPGDAATGMRAIYDVDQGSSGAAVLLANSPTHLIGINHGASFSRRVNGKYRAILRECGWPDPKCPVQPITPSTQFHDKVLNYEGVQSCQ